MNNISKIAVSVPIYGTTGANARAHRAVKVQDFKKILESEGVNFDTYTIRKGEILRFPKLEEMEVEWVAIRKGETRGYHIVKCESEFDGRKKITWFGLPALSKRAHFEGTEDEDFNTPVNETWYDLGNNYARLAALAEMGEIRGEETITVEVPVFDAAGNRLTEQVLDEDNNPVIEDGKEKVRTKRREQKVVVITPYEPQETEDATADQQ